jgi:hypothetical protein
MSNVPFLYSSASSPRSTRRILLVMFRLRLISSAKAGAMMSAAQGAVADSLTDLELIEPMSIVIGDYLKAKLPAQ